MFGLETRLFRQKVTNNFCNVAASLSWAILKRRSTFLGGLPRRHDMKFTRQCMLM